MSRKYKFGDSDKLYFISFAVVDWIDVFVRKEYKDVVLESWKYCQENKGLEIYGWIIMTSHVPPLAQIYLRWRRYAAKHECVGVSVPING